MGKGIVNVYTHIKIKSTHPSPNTTFAVPKCLAYKTTYVTTVGISSPLNNIIQTEPLSFPNTTNTQDTTVNIDNQPHSFANSQKQNHSTTEPRANNNSSVQVMFESDPQQFQQNTTTNKTHPKLPPYVNKYI